MQENNTPKPWNLKTKEILERFSSNPQEGLTEEEASARLSRYGYNALEEKEESPFRTILEPFREPMMILLLATAGLFAALAEIIDAVALFIIISIMAAVEIYQEQKTESSIRSLRQLSLPTAIVIRGGQHLEVESSRIVPGDILVLSVGRRVVADARLIEAFDLSLDESSLTGESTQSYKEADILLPEDCALGDRRNMVFTGTLVASGKGKTVVVDTGSSTEFGRIATLTESIREKPTPLQVRISELTKRLSEYSSLLVGYPCARQMQHRHVVLSLLLPPDQESPESVHPRVRPFDHPPPCSIAWDLLPLRLVHASPRDVCGVSPISDELVHLGEIICLVKADVLRMLLRWLRSLDDDVLERRPC